MKKVLKPNLPDSATSDEDKIDSTKSPLYPTSEDIYDKEGEIDPKDLKNEISAQSEQKEE